MKKPEKNSGLNWIQSHDRPRTQGLSSPLALGGGKMRDPWERARFTQDLCDTDWAIKPTGSWSCCEFAIFCLAYFLCGFRGGKEKCSEIRAGSLSRLAASQLDFALAGYGYLKMVMCRYVDSLVWIEGSIIMLRSDFFYAKSECHSKASPLIINWFQKLCFNKISLFLFSIFVALITIPGPFLFPVIN